MVKKSNEIEVALSEVVDYLRITGKFAPALAEVIERKITAEAAKKRGMRVTTSELQKAADTFRAVNDLSKARDTERWLRSTRISVEFLEEYLETNILISKFKDTLEKKAHKVKYASKPAIKETIRDMIYQDWLVNQLK